jgi:hypothetical protein
MQWGKLILHHLIMPPGSLRALVSFTSLTPVLGLLFVCLCGVPTAIMATAWESALQALPSEMADQVKKDGYNSATVLAQCFRTEDMLDAYASGLILVRKIVQVEGLDENNIMFSPLVGAMRGLLAAAKSCVSAQEKDLNAKRQVYIIERAVPACAVGFWGYLGGGYRDLCSRPV